MMPQVCLEKQDLSSVDANSSLEGPVSSSACFRIWLGQHYHIMCEQSVHTHSHSQQYLLRGFVAQVLFAQLMAVLRQSHAEQCTECVPAKPGDFFKGPVCSPYLQVGVLPGHSCSSNALADCAGYVIVCMC